MTYTEEFINQTQNGDIGFLTKSSHFKSFEKIQIYIKNNVVMSNTEFGL